MEKILKPTDEELRKQISDLLNIGRISLYVGGITGAIGIFINRIEMVVWATAAFSLSFFAFLSQKQDKMRLEVREIEKRR